MVTAIRTILLALTALHFFGSLWPHKVDREQTRAHHELCVMLGLIALTLLEH